jgi:hypothetical protein
VYVDLFALGSGTTEQVLNEFDWIVGSSPAGNLTATPASQPAVFGKTTSVKATWTGLAAGSRYLARLSYSDGTASYAATTLRVNP